MTVQEFYSYIDAIWSFLEGAIPVISPLITVVLTGFLVYLYKQQSDILAQQKELSKSDQRALPRILTYRLFSWRTLYKYKQEVGEFPDLPDHPERHAIFIGYLSNPGKGYADNLHIELQIRSPSFTFSIAPPLARWTNTDQMYFNEKGGVIAPEENETTMYTASFWFSYADLPEEFVDSEITFDNFLTPSEILWALEDIGDSPVEIGLFLHYEDGTGVREPIQLLTSKIDLESYNDLTEAWRSGGKPSGDMKPLFGIESS